MAKPQAYQPAEGYRFKLLARHSVYSGRTWEHCDYATDRDDRRHLMENYRLAYGAGWEFRAILLPAKYWPKAATVGVQQTA
jgi:hypothetical protein